MGEWKINGELLDNMTTPCERAFHAGYMAGYHGQAPRAPEHNAGDYYRGWHAGRSQHNQVFGHQDFSGPII